MRSQSVFLLSSRTRTRSNRLSKGLASAILTDRGSFGSYWLFGLVAARMVVRVFSLHTILWREGGKNNNAEDRNPPPLSNNLAMTILPSLGHANGLLLHRFMDADAVVFLDAVEFIDAA